MTTTVIETFLTAPAPLTNAPPDPVRELLEYMDLWDSSSGRLPRVDPHPGSAAESRYLYLTELTHQPKALESWAHFRQLLEQVIGRADADPEAFQYLSLVNGDRTSVWTQMTPLGPDQHYVDLSDGAGWVDELVPSDPDTPWSTDQTEAIMRLWVTQRFQRADARRSAVTR